MQLNVVIRPFEGAAARLYAAGEIVDVTEWRHARSLTERRYIRPATDSELAQATAPVEAGTVLTRKGKAAPNAE